MLTGIEAYSSLVSPLAFTLGDPAGAETDLIQLRNVEGLDPVKASISTSPFGSVDGSSYTGGSIADRNIVLTLRPNPDWDEYTPSNLRTLIYKYFMPKKSVRLVFYSDDKVPVEISGIVEDVSPNIFSKDVEVLVSIICPEPHFRAVDPIVLTGQTGDEATVIEYNGTVETGIRVKVTATEDTPPEVIAIQFGDPVIRYFGVIATVDSEKYFELNSIPTQKFVQNVDIDTEEITNLLGKIYIQEGSLWPILVEGENEFLVITDEGVHDWELTYFERFGGF